MSTTSANPSSHDDGKEVAAAKEDAWSVTARDYSNQITRLTSLYANDLILLLHPYITKAKVILDVGCGTGAFVHAYLQQYPNGIPGQTIISSDLSPAMLDQARLTTSQTLETGNQTEFATKLVFQLEDGTKLEGIADGSVDIVVSLYGVFLIPDQVATLQAVRRVLQPQTGIFANSAWTVPSHAMDPTFGGNFQLAFQKAVAVMSAAPSVPTKDKEAPSILQQSHPILQWIHPDQIARNLTQQEFGTTQVYRIFHSMVWSSFDALYNIALQNPLCAVTADTTEEQLLLMRNTLLEFCVPLEEDRQRLGEHKDGYSPFVLWTSSNLSLTHVSNIQA